jgi:hypothetical protein
MSTKPDHRTSHPAAARTVTLASLLAATLGAAANGGPPIEAYEWTYLRPGNTGVMGDESDAIWIAPDGRVHLGGYVPSFEEGGFSRFVPEEHRWENFSNVDHPVIGDPADTGSARISDFALADDGTIWMGTWRGALSFDPAIGAAVAHSAARSPVEAIVVMSGLAFFFGRSDSVGRRNHELARGAPCLSEARTHRSTSDGL